MNYFFVLNFHQISLNYYLYYNLLYYHSCVFVDISLYKKKEFTGKCGENLICLYESDHKKCLLLYRIHRKVNVIMLFIELTDF